MFLFLAIRLASDSRIQWRPSVCFSEPVCRISVSLTCGDYFTHSREPFDFPLSPFSTLKSADCFLHLISTSHCQLTFCNNNSPAYIFSFSPFLQCLFSTPVQLQVKETLSKQFLSICAPEQSDLTAPIGCNRHLFAAIFSFSYLSSGRIRHQGELSCLS